MARWIHRVWGTYERDGVSVALPYAVLFYGLFQESNNPVIRNFNIPAASLEDV